MNHLKRAKWMLGVVAFGLFVSGVTVWPAIWELKTGVHLVWRDKEPTGVLHGFVVQAIAALVSI